MNWGEIQIESLKKMFLNKEDLVIGSLPTYKTDKDYKTYLFAMPQACNEAINYITNVLNSNEYIEDITKTNVNDYYNLSDLILDYKKLKDVICSEGIVWKKINNDNIYIENWNNGTVKVLYEVKPTIITSTTSNNQEIEMPSEYSRLIPLYIAGELYKDDDLSLSTMYMNEFMTLINSFVDNNTNFSNPRIQSVFNIE